jgi:beta-lactamase regulating signal transducer with metallopeptidase domain
MIEFVLKSFVCLFVFYIFFDLFLAKENIPQFKRYYLLFVLLFSFVIPLIKIKVSSTILPVLNFNISHLQVQEKNNITDLASQGGSSFQLAWLFYAFYTLIGLLLFIRFLINIFRLIRLRKNNPVENINGIKIVLTKQKILPYSFLNSVFVNKKEYENGKISSELLRHELAHIKQKHSLDILVLELVQIIYWFNPLIFFYKRAIRLNHEYLADSFVLNSNVALGDYQKQLINVVFRNNTTYLASNFNYLLVKKRIIMMTKTKSKSIGYKIALIPVLTALLFNFISCNKELMVASRNPEPWWTSVALKHDINLHAYNGFNTFVEMGSTNSIDNKIVTLEDAIFIIKQSSDKYLIIRSPLAYHNLTTKMIEGKEGTFEIYSFNSSDLKPIEKYSLQNFKYQVSE